MRRGVTAVEDIGWNHPPWPKRECKSDLRKMGDGVSASSGQGCIRESTLMWPMLTRTNYSEWEVMMQCSFEAMEIGHVIEPGGAGVKRAQDRQAMGALLRSVPREMWPTLGSKKTVKEAWDAVKTMHVGADRVKEANAQRDSVY